MKNLLHILQKIISIINIKVLSKTFIIGDMGFIYIDSTNHLKKLFGLCELTIGFYIILLGYFVIVYLVKVNNTIMLNEEMNRVLGYLRLLVLIVILIPIFYELIYFGLSALNGLNSTKSFLEIAGVFLIEKIIDLYVFANKK